MKSFTKVLIALSTITILLFTCQPNKPVTNPVITISQGDGECDLILSDNGSTRTYGNNVVTWELGPGVSEIIEIFYKSGDEVFQVGPQKKNPSKTNSAWFGITKNTTDKLTEQYGIKWKDSNGNTCELDPSVKINQ